MPGLYGAAVDGRPFQETYREAVLTAADFRKQWAIASQANAQQAAVAVFLHVVLVHTVDSHLTGRAGAFTDEPERLGHGITNRTNGLYPLCEILLSALERLAQPVVVLGKIKLTSAAGNRAAVFDRIQKLAFLDRLQKTGADFSDLIAAGNEIMYQGAQSAAVDARPALKALQGAKLMVEFLQDLTSHVATGENCQNLEKRGNGGSRRPICLFLDVVEHLLVEELETQERAHTLRQRLLIVRRCCGAVGSNFSGGFGHRRILRYPVLGGK